MAELMNSDQPSLIVSDNKTSQDHERRWTDAELHKLYKEYFERLPGTCPVCASQVSMIMSHENGMTILSIRCRGCGNTATVFG